MNIIDAIYDENLFLPFLCDVDQEVVTWRNWLTALRVLYGLPIRQAEHALIRRCTGRDPALLPPDGFDAALLLTGRRCGKSRCSAIIAAESAVLSGLWERLAKGEKGLVAVVAPTVKQARIVHGYLRAIFSTPLLQAEVVEETKDMGFELRNGVRVEMLAGDYRSIRGYTLLAAIVDEAAFFGITDESKVRTDTELIRAIQPALATTGGRLLAISSPYANRRCLCLCCILAPTKAARVATTGLYSEAWTLICSCEAKVQHLTRGEVRKCSSPKEGRRKS